jgi:MFS family permease
MIRAMSHSPQQLATLRRRTVWTLVGGVGLGSTGHIAAVTVATIVAQDMVGTSAWAGAPAATVVLGSALGSTLLATLMARRGRRIGLSLGYTIGVGGALVATGAVVAGLFPLLLLGTFLIGFGNSSNQLSRYTAADLVPPERRASAIGIVVWGATIGAVVGPNLVSFAGDVALGFDLPRLSGPYLVPIVFVGAAAILSFVFLRPDPFELADESARAREDGVVRPDARVSELLRRPVVLASIVALVTGQVVMVLIMTMTPLHMTDHGHDLAAVGVVISGHTFGMFALSPISGRLTDRFGSPIVIAAGLGVLALSAVMAAVAPAEGGVVLFLALFLLGYGWNLGYVAGSSMLAAGLAIGERTRLQGVTDSMIWSSAAAASVSSGLVVSWAGYATLGLIGAGLVAVPAVILIGTRRRATAVAT